MADILQMVDEFRQIFEQISNYPQFSYE